jgi:hypothetical protein
MLITDLGPKNAGLCVGFRAPPRSPQPLRHDHHRNPLGGGPRMWEYKLLPTHSFGGSDWFSPVPAHLTATLQPPPSNLTTRKQPVRRRRGSRA